MMIRMRWLVVMTSMALAGCVGIGDTAPPEAPFEWSESLREVLPAAEAPVRPRRERITDPQLAALVDKALADSLDVQTARDRINEARALAGVDLSQFRLQLGVSAGATEQQLSENGLLPAGRIPGFETDQTIYEAGFDASWELGLLGRRATVADLGALRVAAPELELAGVEASLVAEIVRRYIEHQRTVSEQTLLGTIVDRSQALLEATQKRRDHGEASDFDVELASAQLMAARARLPGAQRAQRVAAHRLVTLTGQPPSALSLASAEGATAAWTLGTSLEATTSDVLRRRPDIRLAEVRYAQSVRDLDLARL
ncbi:MAG: TolC family protein [Pseudomonadota bacterium]